MAYCLRNRDLLTAKTVEQENIFCMGKESGIGSYATFATLERWDASVCWQSRYLRGETREISLQTRRGIEIRLSLNWWNLMKSGQDKNLRNVICVTIISP